MKASYQTRNGALTFEIEGDGPKAIFGQLATIQEVFDAETVCGVCQCEAIRYQERVVDDYHFFELACTAPGCHARFSFGQAKKGGGLFPKRKDDDGRWLPNGGWSKYVKPGEEQDEPPARSTQQSAPKSARQTSRVDFWEGKLKAAPKLFPEACLAYLEMLQAAGGSKGEAKYQQITDEVTVRFPNGIRQPADMIQVVRKLDRALSEFTV